MSNELLEKVKRYRETTFRINPSLRLKSAEEAVDFVEERGFIAFWPITGIPLPSLWNAVAGDRPVPDDHDDPGQITWTWKDELLGKHRWYYGRVLGRRNSMIALQMLPNFYALSPNYGDYEHDYLDQYEMGALTSEAKTIYEVLLREGPLDTLSLRKAAHMKSKESESRFKRALDTLQLELKILPIGISAAGTWHYAFIYDLVPRHFPDLDKNTHAINEKEARQKILLTYLRSVGGITTNVIPRLFGWKMDIVDKTINLLEQQSLLVRKISNTENSRSSWVLLPELY